MNQRPSSRADRVPLILTVGAFAVMLACLPVASMMDDNNDEDRPMYQNVLSMVSIQSTLIANDERPIATTVTDGETVELGSHEFVAAAGVTVVVRVSDKKSFCVSASNVDGARAKERCITPDTEE